MLPRMRKPEAEQSYPDLMSHREIIERFHKLFGRDMTPQERDIFFLPDDPTLAKEEKMGAGAN